MIYSVIETRKGESHGLKPKYHVLSQGGEKMAVNENELRLVNADIEYAAKILGGRLLQAGEVKNELKK